MWGQNGEKEEEKAWGKGKECGEEIRVGGGGETGEWGRRFRKKWEGESW